ncbi:Signal peptidase I [Carbonactinospora thermoautotrophica]|uniref:Signal peptidase I n=1 Tax=Carbonactinospora thermoautotrophica TaxID=1469144 RepID=A0A132MP88_9ACTN|nr:signal peptidase I [Carbonactinospora thermoautotrophica]KWW99668.1 Signal peptidase I [Carbonactinospora thermoautotrophica]
MDKDVDTGADAPQNDREQAGKRNRDGRGQERSFWYELPFLVAIALLLALLVKTFLVQAFYIPSGSMENTLQVGDRVLVNKLANWLGDDVDRGEIVVFDDPGGWLQTEPEPPANPLVRGVQSVFVFFGLLPSSQKDLIKRVIAVGGDRVACCDSQGRVTVNGVPLDEPYVFPGNPSSTVTFDVTVPEGRLWVMGDHREVSGDSSKHLGEPGGGTIPEDKVVGRAFAIIWPLDRIRSLPVPDTFKQAALASADRAGSVAPVLLGFAGALPVVVLRRRLRHRMPACRASGSPT